MRDLKVIFVIDKVEFQYFEINELVTSFWLIKECNERGWKVFITTIDRLYLNKNNPEAIAFETFLTDKNGIKELKRTKNSIKVNLNDFDIALFRPDPPVDNNYLNALYIMDFVDKTKVLLINDSDGIRRANEKIFINNFPEFCPANITTCNNDLIKTFLNEYGEIVIKPLNKCFGKGVFYLNKEDKNINAILDVATNSGKTAVMAQEYLKAVKNGDKRVIIIGGEIYDESVVKVSGKDDFKFNSHKDEYLLKSYVTEEKNACKELSVKLMKMGLHFAGVDMLDGKIIEVNVTSPCFFIKEINRMFNVKLEKRIVNYIESLPEKALPYAITSSLKKCY